MNRKNQVRGRIAALVVACGWGMVAAGTLFALPQKETDSTKLSNEEALRETAAVAAQNQKKFREAADTWRDLLDKFPQSALRTKALHQLGICEIQLGEYTRAEEHLREAIRGTSPSETQTLARAQLFLGFSRLKLGEIAISENNSAAANQWFTSAADALGVVLEKHPTFESAHEAAYFQGSAFEQLDNLERAVASYRKVLEFENSKFKFDALWALGDLNARLKNYAAARDYLQAYLADGQDLPPINEVRFRAAMVNWQLAREAKDKGNSEQALRLQQEAQQQFEQLAAGSSPQKEEAAFNLALLQFQTGNSAASLKNFEAVAQGNHPRLAVLAAVNLGRQYLDAKQWDQATTWLNKALQSGNEQASEAAHWLAQTLLAQGKSQEAYDLAKDWSSKTEGVTKQELKMDQADAAFQIPERRQEAYEHYLELAQQDWPRKAVALYNAAYAALSLNQNQDALRLAREFQTQHAKHEFSPDAQEIEAEALLAEKNFDEAIRKFQFLCQSLKDNPKHLNWRIRLGLANYLGEKLDAAETTLSETIQLATDPQIQREARHWLGLVRNRRKLFPEAIEAFTQSSSAGTWQRTPETLLGLVEAYGGAGDWSSAEKTMERLIQEHAQSEATPRAVYLVAEHYRADQTGKAAALYERLSQMDTAGEYGAYARMKRGWLLVDGGDFEGARTEFQKALALAKQDKDLRHKSQIGLATALRHLSQTAEGLAELEKVLADSPSAPLRVDARYESGLTLASARRWPEALQQFEALLTDGAAQELAPNIRYEYAWALQGNNQPEKALLEFEKLANAQPTTPLGADAQFQVAEALYTKKDFEAALKAYDKALAAAPATLKERILYRQGWAFFNLKDYPKSYEKFEQQTREYTDGKLFADGLYMLSESAFQQKQYETAYKNYRTARPVMEASSSVSPTNLWLSCLHAAQSANQLKKFEEARELARQLADDAKADEGLRLDAQLELGLACQGLNDSAGAVAAWTLAAEDLGKTGVQARYLLGAALFVQKKFREATLQFTLARNGYGGTAADPAIDSWQALSTFEIARCKNCLAQEAAKAGDKKLSRQLVSEAVQYLRDLTSEFPGDPLVEEARKEIAKLEEYLKKTENN